MRPETTDRLVGVLGDGLPLILALVAFVAFLGAVVLRDVAEALACPCAVEGAE